MDLLRKSFEKLGCRNVQTYIQSGNVVFECDDSAASFCQTAEARILADFGFTASVIVRTPAELAKAMKNSPFAKGKGIDPSKLFVVFLSATPVKAAVAKLAGLPAGTAQFLCIGRELHLYCPDGMGKTRLPNFDKVLSVNATARNWNTVNKLCEMAQAIDGSH
jgi:uncharacterized protein (DUF1697 family)